MASDKQSAKNAHYSSDNLKERIEFLLRSEMYDTAGWETATDQILALIEGLVPPNDAYRLNSFAHKLYAPSEDYAEGFKTGYQKCRQDILTKIKESK